MLLHGPALGNKGILAGLRGGASEAALDSGRAQGAQNLALSKHVVCVYVLSFPRQGFVEWRVGAFGGGGFVSRSSENESGVYSDTVANQTIDDSNVARLCKAPSLPTLTWGGGDCRGLAVHVKSRKTSDALDRADIVI